MSTVLVTGGTGLLGRRVVRDLAAAGHTVRVLSRRAVAPPVAGAEVAVADLRTGWGLHQAVAATTAIVHCATDPRDGRAVDVAGTERLLAAARGTGRPHLVYISIVGIDRIPTEYYRAKLAAEQAIAGSGLPWTALRTTQFHEFALDLVRRVARLPVVPLPRGWQLQPVDVDEVADRLAAAVASGPGQRLPDLGGPQVLPMADIVRQYLDAAGRRRPVLELPVPGAFFAALRQGANLAPRNRAGGRTWAQFLAGQTRPHLVKR
jgi:uncharacterized protein YbjT (DUF2867 family)